jgi:hypothetical protein
VDYFDRLSIPQLITIRHNAKSCTPDRHFHKLNASMHFPMNSFSKDGRFSRHLPDIGRGNSRKERYSIHLDRYFRSERSIRLRLFFPCVITYPSAKREKTNSVSFLEFCITCSLSKFLWRFGNECGFPVKKRPDNFNRDPPRFPEYKTKMSSKPLASMKSDAQRKSGIDLIPLRI